MYPIAIAADREATAAEVRDRLAGGLAEHGRVAVVTPGSPDGSPPPGADVAYRLGEDGGWSAVGETGSLREVLERLTPAYDYALVTGYQASNVPGVAIGVEYDGETLLSVDDPGAVDADALVEALEGVEPLETLESLVAAVKRDPDADRSGAIATFTGRVRERDSPDDEPTTHLEFEKYAGVAEERMAEISRELEERDGVQRVVMHHRTGVIESGEDIVFVVVLAGHREEAFRTVEDGINRLKAEVPIFKKEVTVEESFWVHERS